MKFRSHWALAKGVVLESVRRKDLWVVAILGLVVLVAASAIGFFGSAGLEVFMKDLAVTVLGLFSTVIAAATATRVLPDEIKNRTLYPLLARPISRLDLIVGKWFGAVLVTWLGFALLTVTTAIAIAMFHVRFEPIMAQYVFLKLLGLTLVCSVGVALSVYMTPAASLTMTLVLSFGASTFSRAIGLGFNDASPVIRVVMQTINAALPQTHLFDIGGRAVYVGWSPAPMWVVGALFGYLVVYSIAMLSVCYAKMRRKAL